MRPLLATTLLLSLSSTALADDSPDVLVTWTVPTCDDPGIQAAAATRADTACGRSTPTDWTYQYETDGSALGCKVWVHAWCPDDSTKYKAPGEVKLPTLYFDKDYNGLALALKAHKTDLQQVPVRTGGEWKRKTSSLKVPAGWTVRLCRDLGDETRCSDFQADHRDLGSTYVGGDQARFVEAKRGSLSPLLPCPIAYERDGFGGKELELCDATPDLAGSSWDDTISSVRVPAGWEVRLCGNAKGGGDCSAFAADVSRLSATVVGNDKTTSITIVKRPR